MKVGVLEHFDSMHLLPGHPKCGVPHGHTYRVEVVVEGPVRDGMVVDFDVLKRSLREILKTYDHTDLNRLLPMPSCENIALDLLARLKTRVPHEKMSVRVWEGDGKWAECEG
jgi:6-pyruvoyltetrahydropterin/6-carboxytetrahydropterin synthase